VRANSNDHLIGEVDLTGPVQAASGRSGDLIGNSVSTGSPPVTWLGAFAVFQYSSVGGCPPVALDEYRDTYGKVQGGRTFFISWPGAILIAPGLCLLASLSF
jgi:hypothetical protein